ncbi:response regulator [Hwanghaeella grinnelliae]|uniref:Sensory/regulatory protein RpfC n=1 Tax=Hwanghaeella grinnelliae TaxID=2500179 RepID=A0A437QU75_9PROT|nr:PAS domain-containing hybrid sensor histidine kinase/response regulator [Hwanghaeella grinnelliae]RVU38048.1 response regulator [Hwanghaeella grinnelliae]
MSQISKRLVYQIGGVIFAGLVVVSTISLYIAFLDRQIVETEKAWVRYNDQSVKLSLAFADLKGSLGYGGFIHQFKNFVLRGDPEYATAALASLANAAVAMSDMERLDREVAADIRPHLRTVDATVQKYRANLGTVLEKKDSVSVEELDALVRVDDSDAFAALEKIEGIVSGLATAREAISAQKMRDTVKQIEQGLWLIAVVVFAVGYMVFHIRKLERVRAAERVATEQTNAILNSSPEAVLVVDNQGRINRANEQASVLFGYMPEEMLNLSINKLVPADFREGHGKNIREFFANGRRRVMSDRSDLAALKKNGELVAVDISLQGVVVDGMPLTIAAVRDVTEQRALERALISAREAAEHANDMKSAFVASMSHEIRTPLTGLLGMADLLEATSLDDKQAEFVNTIKSSGRHLQEVLNDILDLSKLQAGKMKITPAKFEAKNLVRLVDAIYKTVATDKGLDFQITVSELAHSKVLVSDVVRLRQVLLNLVGNAVKFTEKGAIAVSLDLSVHSDHDAELSLVVQDSGIGISENKIKAIFDPFVQVEDHRTKSYVGTGLGLAICNRIVELMGGSITMESEPGRGTTVTALFPIKFEEDRRAEKRRDEEDGRSEPLVPVRKSNKKSVLVADDSNINRRIVQGVLSRWGHDIDFAVDGQEAIEKLLENTYDLVLLDIHMPKFDGVEVLARVIDADRRDGKFIAFTADVMSTSVDAYRQKGFDDVLSKPIDWNRLQGFLDDTVVHERQSAKPQAV